MSNCTSNTSVIAYRGTTNGRQEYLLILEGEGDAPLAALPTQLTDKQVVAFCRTCGWDCREVLR